MTLITRESPASALPDPQTLTIRLKEALEAAIADLREKDTTHGEVIIAELEAICAALTPPPEAYPGLDELDQALTGALQSLEDLSSYAPLPEVRQILKTLRRTILIDRGRIDPDERRHAVAVAVAIRQIWLIGHRAGLLKANMQQLQISQALNAGVQPDKLAAYQEALDLLTQYIAAQEGYGSSVRQEIEELNALLLS